MTLPRAFTHTSTQLCSVRKESGTGEEAILTRESVHASHSRTSLHPASVDKQRKYRLFQTVNHAKVLWDSKVKSKSVFGGHLNICSARLKHEQLEQLLIQSNLDCLCLSETFLKPYHPDSIVHVPGYKIYRRDHNHGKRGGVMIYVKDSFQSSKIEAVGDALECVGVQIRLSPEMKFSIIVLYRPPTSLKANDVFFDNLINILKKCDTKETLLMGDFNINWLNKNDRKKLKEITQKLNFTQMMDKATRITKTSQKLIDLVFANKADRITKVYNLLTGLSDYNLTLVARKLSKERSRNEKTTVVNESVSYIPKTNTELFDDDIRKVNWFEMVNDKDCNTASSDLIQMVQNLMSKYSKVKKVRQNGKKHLPWLNSDIWKLMRTCQH